MQSDEGTLSPISEETFDRYEFNPHTHVVVQDHLNRYHHISTPADDSSSITNNYNIPAIIIDVINDAWELYKQHPKQYNTDCYDYYYCSYGSSHQNGKTLLFHYQMFSLRNLWPWVFTLHSSGGSLSEEEGIPDESARLMEIETYHYPS